MRVNCKVVSSLLIWVEFILVLNSMQCFMHNLVWLQLREELFQTTLIIDKILKTQVQALKDW